LPIEKPAKELAMRSLGLLLAALALIAVVASLVTVVADGRKGPGLMARPFKEASAEDAQLALLSVRYEGSNEHGEILFEGQTKNVSDVPLIDVIAIVSLYDVDPALITASHAPIQRDVLSPGEVSTFSVAIGASPRARSFGVIFQQPSGSTIPMRDERPD
jgi:hypothetical protein